MKKHDAFLSLFFSCCKQSAFTKCEKVDVMYLQMHFWCYCTNKNSILKGYSCYQSTQEYMWTQYRCCCRARIHVNAVQILLSDQNPCECTMQMLLEDKNEPLWTLTTDTAAGHKNLRQVFPVGRKEGRKMIKSSVGLFSPCHLCHSEWVMMFHPVPPRRFAFGWGSLICIWFWWCMSGGECTSSYKYLWSGI
jgi:hypothetical protein